MGWGEDRIGRILRINLGHVKFEISVKCASGGVERQNTDSEVKLLGFESQLYHFLAV